jgi:hypothetical protein
VRWASVTLADYMNEVDLSITNTSDHAVDPSDSRNPNAVATVCAPDLSADGVTSHPLVSNQNLFFMTPSGPMAPGEGDARGGDYVLSPRDVGTVTCEGVIVTSTNWTDGSIRVVSRLTNVAPVTFTVLPTPPTTGRPSPPSP